MGERWRDISSVIRALLKSPKLQSFKKQRGTSGVQTSATGSTQMLSVESVG
jgi:hypothetical protein